MSDERIVIVGGGPAGLAAARGYRAAGGAGALQMVTDDDRPPYNRPPLTKGFLRGEAGEDELPLEIPEGLEVLFGEAVGLDVDARVVHLADRRQLRYDGLVLATGAEPVRLPLEGADGANVHVIRTVAQSAAVRDAVSARTHLAVIGTGFIGCEAAASLAMRGAHVTVYGQDDVPQESVLGEAAGARIAGWLADLGAELRLGCALREIPDADLVLMAVGVRPRVALAAAAGLRLGEGGRAIATDGAMRTTADGVFAAGDVAQAQHPIAGRPLRVEHWGEALAQGEVAGRGLVGERVEWDGVPGFWSTIGEHTLKYSAWGDGFASSHLVDHGGGAWTVWYADEDERCVGVLCHERDDDYDRGAELIAAGESSP